MKGKELVRLRKVFQDLRESALKEGCWRIERKYKEFLFELDKDGTPVKIRNPNAFFIGALVDRQVKEEVAWRFPLELKRRLGTLDPRKIAGMDPKALASVIARKPALHRLPNIMARVLVESMKLLVEKYDGDASKIWSTAKNYEDLKRRLLEFPGIGEKIARMIVKILNDYFGYRFEGGEIPVDRHTRRVVDRLTGGTMQPDEFAQVLFPENPYLADSVLFYVGKTFCHPINPLCGDCPLSNYCRFWKERGKDLL